MPGYFLDSSAIAKLYHVEVGTPVIQSLAAQANTTLYISRLAVVEVPSAFAGKVRTGQLAVADLDLLRTRFRGDLRRKVVQTVAMKAGHFRDAERLIHTHTAATLAYGRSMPFNLRLHFRSEARSSGDFRLRRQGSMSCR